MSIQIIPIQQQGKGAFNGGEIVENKPIGFPQDQASIGPYSNLFYWAHARALKDSTIGLHPHQGFEICSFVLKGEIRHYDTKMKEWRPLQAGDVQIIRAGSGISHSEWMGQHAEMFQIWFDPNLLKTIEQPATYDDYAAASFPVRTEDGTQITTIVGNGSPFQMDTPGVTVQRIQLDNSSFNLETDPQQIHSLYVLGGTPIINGQEVQPFDFIIAKDLSTLEITASLGAAALFTISAPSQLDYKTYRELRSN
jgi:redox-sensitive bicupin YhaK (pirin superfamily)